MKRRTFLTMLGLAPAAPALVTAAPSEDWVPAPYEAVLSDYEEVWGPDFRSLTIGPMRHVFVNGENKFYQFNGTEWVLAT